MSSSTGSRATVSSGVAFCRSVYGTTPMGDVVEIEGGLEAGLPDVLAFPDLSTLHTVPWEPGVAHVIADMFNPDGSPSAESPRAVLKRVIAKFAELGMKPIVGPELEFYVMQHSDKNASGWERYGEATGNVYVAGLKGDPENVLIRTLRHLASYGLEVVAANHEFSSGQFEINLWHSEALDAADRSFRFKTAIQELARAEDKLATFMAKPFNDEGGSGFHIHFSTWDDDGNALFDDPESKDGLSQDREARHRRHPRPRARAGRGVQPDDQLVQAVRPGHPRAVADRLGLRQPQCDGPDPAGAGQGVAAGASARRRQRQSLPGDRRATGRRLPRDPRRTRTAGAAGGLRL